MRSTGDCAAPSRAANARSARVAARAAGLALALALAACRDDAPPPAPVAAAAAAAENVGAPPVAGSPAPMPMRFSVDDPRIGSLVGARTPGMGLSSDGRPGWMVYGPYVTVPAGHYDAVVQGALQAGHDGPLHVDVAAAKGTQVIAAVDAPLADLAPPAAGGALVVLPFDLAVDTPDVEVRVRVTETSRVSVSGVDIRPRP